MKQKIAILGSTGSIGVNTLEIIKSKKKNYDIILLTAKRNYKLLEQQVKNFSVKNIVLYDYDKYLLLKEKFKKKKINVFSDFKSFKLHNKNKKVDYTMCAISGLHGLKPLLEAISISKKVAIANKESIICGWNLISKKLKKYNTKFVPVDSEHFSIWNLVKNNKNIKIKKIIITASGGPFLKINNLKLKKIKVKDAIKHPNWKMGKKISVDSSTLMNKIFEVIEAYKIFNYDFNKYEIFIHPQSYVHAIVQFKNGLTKMLIHDTDMKIPIANTLNENNKNFSISSHNVDPKKLNKIEFFSVDKKRFPVINFLKLIPKKDSLYETVLISANDTLVDLFLKNKVEYLDIYKNLNKILKLKNFAKLKKKQPKNVDSIYKIYEMVRLKTISLSV